MRIPFVVSLLMALLVSFSSLVYAASSASPVAEAQMTPAAQLVMINLNTADEAMLQKELSGVGLAKARAIVAYREANGDFASTDELLEVKGIGKAIFEKNRDKISVD